MYLSQIWCESLLAYYGSNKKAINMQIFVVLPLQFFKKLLNS